MPDAPVTDDHKKAEQAPDTPAPKAVGADHHDTTEHHDDATQNNTSSWLITQVLEDWDQLKTTFTANKSAESKPTDFNIATAGKAADNKPASSDWNWTDFDNIYNQSSQGGVGKSGSTINVADSIKLSDSKLAPGPDDRWFGGITKMAEQVTSTVSQGWDKLSDSFADSYKAITGDSTNKTTKVEATLGSDGKVDYFENTTDNGTRTLSATEQRVKDDKGNVIIRDSVTKEVTSQSADGDHVYTHKADGTEIYRDHNTEYTKNKDGTYNVRDDKGNETQISKERADTLLLGGKFQAAQVLTHLDMRAIRAEKAGTAVAGPNGVGYHGRDGSLLLSDHDGHKEIVTPDGKHLRFDQKQDKVEIEDTPDHWRTLTPAEFAQMHHCQRNNDGHGGHNYKVGGVTLNADGSMVSPDAVKIGAQTSDGKIAATIPAGTEGAKPATLVSNRDGSSDLVNNGTDTKFDPNNSEHRVERFGVNADGSLGPSQFNYNADNGSFWTPDVQFDPNGTTIDWAGITMESDGTAFNTSGVPLFGDDPITTQTSGNHAESAVRSADSAVSSVSAKIGSQALDSGDVAALQSSLGDLDGALATALSCGNFDAACQIYSAKGEVASAISAASQQVAIAETLRGNNTTDEIDSRLAYMSQFGISGLNEEQTNRLSA